MGEKREQVFVGLFVLVAVVLLVTTVFALSGAFAGSAKSFHAKFPNAAGLEPGASVHYAGGPKIGRVEKMQIDPANPGLIDMTFSVKNDLPIKTDSSVAILSYSPLGDNHLEIKPGTAQAALANSGSQLNAKPYMGFNDLAEQISNLSPQAQELMTNLNLRVKELSVTIARVNDLLNDRNRANLSASLAHVNGMLAEDRPLIKSTLGNVNTASRKIEPLLDKLSKTTDQANETLKHVDGMIGDNRADVRASVVKLRESLETVSVLTKRLNRTLDVNSENIDEILENMRKVTENLQEFTELIKTRPSSLINYSGPREHRPGELP
jgi:phospholipid/cholesterol/gamma-HCH transport system substrate-binding protein